MSELSSFILTSVFYKPTGQGFNTCFSMSHIWSFSENFHGTRGGSLFCDVHDGWGKWPGDMSLHIS